jgi:hypothetical protein
MNPNDPSHSTDAFPALVGSSYHEPLLARQSRIQAVRESRILIVPSPVSAASSRYHGKATTSLLS